METRSFSEDYTMIILYVTEIPPHILTKLLTPIMLVLEYVKKYMDVDEIHFLKSKKKGRTPFPIVMGGYAINGTV